MSLDSTEEEQIDQIKQFFKENGLFMLIAIVLVVGGNIGYDYYETSERTAAEAASLDFSNFQKAVDEVVATGSGREDALAIGEAIKADHPGTAYAALGALQLARLYFDDKAYAKAETELSFAADSNSSLIAPLARIRLGDRVDHQFPGHPRDRHGARGVDVGEHDQIGIGETSGVLRPDLRHAVEAVRLEDGDHATPAVTGVPRRREHR